MSARRPIDLQPHHRAIVQSLLAALRGPLGEVRVYGSRAAGTAKPGSDLDLVIFPPISPSQLDWLRLALEDSALPFNVDLIRYESIDSPSLRADIDQTARCLFPARPNRKILP